MNAGNALILGGTKGLGRALALEASERQFLPIVTGRSSILEDKELRGVCGWLRFDLVKEVDLFKRVIAVLRRSYQNDINYVFWNAGIFLRKPIRECGSDELDAMIATHVRGPIRFLQEFHREQKKPYHLIVIASTSSWRVRDDETLYCALKAAKAAFTRNFARELARDLPGSKTMLVNPGGMKTPNFWSPSGQDISSYMEPSEVAKIIWREALEQNAPYHEMQILRKDDGSPRVEYGPKLPELPF